jgi:hypothetical protein
MQAELQIDDYIQQPVLSAIPQLPFTALYRSYRYVRERQIYFFLKQYHLVGVHSLTPCIEPNFSECGVRLQYTFLF